jgi:mediator of RNA polymerase II transcription subunit 18
VELSVLAPSGNDSVAEDMKNFSDQLKPLVNLDKYDLRRIS